MTESQHKRVLASLAEARTLLAREMTYLPQHQKADMIIFYTRHISILEKLLAKEQ